ncbi:MAG: phage gp6-like head-tail connector protein [Oscillospiraceae bacterium]|nr:phage gp6-like head-tail connector protein [Oscillospiraceae bacterium]
MKVSELTKETITLYGKVDSDAEDAELLETLFLPAAKEYMMQHAGMTTEQMDEHQDVTVAVCALCIQMYDNRSVSIDTDKLNQVVVDIINRYSMNLIPRRDET